MKRFFDTLSQLQLPPIDVLLARFLWWIQRNWRWWSISAGFHSAVLCVLIVILGTYVIPMKDASATFDSVKDNALKDVPLYELGKAPYETTSLETEQLMDIEPPGQTAKFFDNSEDFEDEGGGTKLQSSDMKTGGAGGFDIKAFGQGPIVRGKGGVGVGEGTGVDFGSGGAGSGWANRGKGNRPEILGRLGGTRASERAVAAGLNWLARHQNSNGSWSLDFHERCKDDTCTSKGTDKRTSPSAIQSDAAATGMALMAFLGAGQTHQSDGPFKDRIAHGISWLIKNQEKDGSLAVGDKQYVMYTHGIAAIALCEAYGMTKDKKIERAAQASIDFIEKAQNRETGGWRYIPGDTGDTSVFGWQLMALKSAQMAGLRVNYTTFNGAEKWLKSVAQGEHGGRFSYMPEQRAEVSTTSIGLLCQQYLNMRPDAPAMIEGKDFILNNLPDDAHGDRNFYYWYYATQTMQNLLGTDWDTWNRKMRRVLIDTQESRKVCASGSWDPNNPSADRWGQSGGRLMLTAFGTMTLEVYYRKMPLFDPDKIAPPGTSKATSSSKAEESIKVEED